MYFGYPDGYSSAVPGYCLLLAFISWMAENVFLPNISLQSYIVLFPPPHRDQGRTNIELISFLGWEDLIVWELPKEVQSGM